jgi:alpha-galactosidase
VIHSDRDREGVTMCLASGWFDYLLERISENVRRYGIKWLMIDQAMLTSAYVNDKTRSGCHAKNHLHQDRDESLYMIYERAMELLDRLKQRFPDLYIDCTFELWGHFHVIDYALIEHADGDRISNIASSLLARQLRYDRARVVPPSPMLWGNLRMDQDNPQLSFTSLVCSTPVMFKRNVAWLTGLEDKYHWTRYYQTSDIFGRPAASGWDGCARFNPEQDGGILTVIRNDSPERLRVIPLPWVNAAGRYRIHSSLQENDPGIFEGRVLKSEGLRVEIPERNQGAVLSIEPAGGQ